MINTHHAAEKYRAALHGPSEADIPETDSDKELHARCEAWARWSTSRKFFAPAPPLSINLLAKLQPRSSSAGQAGGPDAVCSAYLWAMHRAISAKPADTDRWVFELFYLHRVRNIKVAAQALGISRAAWYRRLGSFRRMVCAEAARIEASESRNIQQMQG